MDSHDPRQGSRETTIDESSRVVICAVISAEWHLHDPDGSCIGTVPLPRKGLMFGRNAPTLLLRAREASAAEPNRSAA
jgi:hypothetical protein